MPFQETIKSKSAEYGGQNLSMLWFGAGAREFRAGGKRVQSRMQGSSEPDANGFGAGYKGVQSRMQTGSEPEARECVPGQKSKNLPGGSSQNKILMLQYLLRN